MTHDFAKIRPEPLLEKKPAQTPPAWSMMITGIVVGMALGVFASVLLYVSGHVPAMIQAPARSPAVAAASEPAQARDASNETSEESGLQLEFYHELRNYEVPVDATPVEIVDANAPLEVTYMLQSGAFQQEALARQEAQRQQALGLETRVQSERLTGRTLYLVQSGPYLTQGQLDAAETLLRRNNIPSLRTRAQ